MECSPTGLLKPFATAAASHRPTALRHGGKRQNSYRRPFLSPDLSKALYQQHRLTKTPRPFDQNSPTVLEG